MLVNECEVEFVAEPVSEFTDGLYCHIRHIGCSSPYAACGTFKPYSHSPWQVIYAGTLPTGEACWTCGKELCPACIVAAAPPCPQCGRTDNE